MSRPPVRDEEALLRAYGRRIQLLERRLATAGSGGGGGGGGGASGVRAGFISPYAGANAPTGWLMCDGAAYSPTAFPDLYAAIGTVYGGTTSAPLLPNLKGRIPVGKDAAQTEFDVLGETGGAKTVALTSAQLAAHQHPLSYNGGNVAYAEAGGATRYTVGFGATRPGNGDVMSGFQSDKSAAGSGDAHNNLQPYLTLNYIIATGFGSTPAGGSANPLPPPAMTAHGGIGAITATTFTAIPNHTPITLVLAAPAWVEVTYEAWLSMTSTTGEVRAGVALSGAITQAPNATQAGTASWGAVAIRSGVQGAGSEQYAVTKTVLVPAGTTVFTPQAYIGGSPTAPQANYGLLTVTPLAWDGSAGAITGTDTGWINFPAAGFVSGFTNNSTAPVRYRVKDGVVYVMGTVDGTFPSGAYTIFSSIPAQMPVPAGTEVIRFGGGGSGSNAMFGQLLSGNIYGAHAAGSNRTWFSFSTSYPVG